MSRPHCWILYDAARAYQGRFPSRQEARKAAWDRGIKPYRVARCDDEPAAGQGEK